MPLYWMETLVKQRPRNIDPAALSDEELLRRIAEKDLSAFEELSRRFLSKAWRFDMQFLQNASDAEDAVQEKFLRLWRSAGHFEAREGSRVSNYLLKIDKNICLDMLARASRRYESSVGDMQADSDTDTPDALMDYLAFQHWSSGSENDDFTGFDARDRIMRILAFTRHAFTPKQFLCFWGFVNGMTYKELAATYDLGFESVRGLIARAFKRVREAFAEEVTST